MQVTVESSSGLERTLKVEVPAEQIDESVEQRLKEMRGRVRLDGFRPGKVPLRVVKQRYGDQVRQEVVAEVMQSSFGEALAEKEIRPAGSPQIEAVNNEPGSALEYRATVEVYPEIELGDLSKVEIEEPQAEVGDADIDKMIDTLREQRKDWEDVDRAAKEGDRVTISFEGFIDGEAFEGGSAENMPIQLGEGRMLKDFEDGLYGIKAGEEKTIEVNFPEDYQAENLKGQKAEFKIKAESVAEPKLPEVDAEFMKAFGVESGDMDDFRAEIRGNMERELRQAVKKNVKQQVMDALVDMHDVELPQSLVQQESERVRDHMVQQMGGAQAKDHLPLELFEQEAGRRVKLGLVVAELVKENDIQLDQDKVESLLKDIASSYEDPDEVINYYRQNQEFMGNIEALAVEEQVVDFVKDKGTVTEKSMSFDEVMNPEPEPAEESEGED